MIYIISPYSHNDHAVQNEREELVAKFCANCWMHGFPVFSPIVYTTALIRYDQKLKDLTTPFWLSRDIELLSCARAAILFSLNGFSDSMGCSAERGVVAGLRIPMLFVNPYNEFPFEERTELVEFLQKYSGGKTK